MHVILWDTQALDVSKDFAGGFGVGKYPGRHGLRDRIIRWFYTRDRRPTALLFGHLAAIFAQLGHRIEYVEDRPPRGADLYVFNPSLITLALERQVIVRLLAEEPAARVLVVGTVATALPQAFEDLGVTIVQGEAEQLLWRMDEVLSRPGETVHLGVVEDLDRLPPPDWSLFRPERFRIGFDFWRFPTALVQASRGCPYKCNYCPYLVVTDAHRVRKPQAVIDEIDHGMRRFGFRSFKFRDPVFGLHRQQTVELAELIGRLPQKIQFSIESRIDVLSPETLRMLHAVGLTSVTVGIETPDDATLARHGRRPIAADRQREFIAVCRGLGIRTVAGFLIGFPEDDEAQIARVRDYAIALGPTFANFNVVTPYPGTAFYAQMRDRLADGDFSRYSVYTPVLAYDHLSRARVEELLAKCFRRFYFRWSYLRKKGSELFIK